MKPWNITFRLTGSFCLLATVLLVVGWQGVSHLQQLDKELQDIVGDQWKEVRLTNEAFDLSEVNSRITLLVFLLDDQDEINRLLAERAANTNRISDLMRTLKPHLDPGKETELFSDVEKTRKPYIESYEKALALLTGHKNDEAHKMMLGVVRPNLAAYHVAWSAFNQHECAEIDQVMLESKSGYITGQREFLLTLLAAGLMTGLIAIFTVRRLGREIGVRHHAEQALQEAQLLLEHRVLERTAELASANETLRLLNSAVLQSKESILITDAELDLPGPGIIFVNPAFTQMTGYTTEEVIGKTPRILQGPHTDPAVLRRLRQNLERGELFAGEAVNYRKDGQEFNLEWQIAPLRDDGGKITNFVAIQRDITERKLAESERTALAAILEVTPDLVSIIDPIGRLTYLNRSARESLGVELDEDISFLVIADFIPNPASHPLLTEGIPIAISKGVWQGETMLLSRRGQEIPVSQIILSHKAPDGKLEFLSIIMRDITERKRIDTRFRRLVDSNVQSVFFWEKNGAITEANDAFLGLVRRTRADLEAGRIDWAAMTPPEYAHLDRHALGEIAANGSCAPYEKEFLLSDGSRVPVLLGAASFTDAPDEGVCFMLDISDRKRLEASMLQSQKMETVGKLAGGVAHEFNSILTAIIGQSESLLGELPAGSELAKSANEIRKAADHAANLTRQLLAFGRKQILQPEILDLNVVLAGMKDIISHLIGRGGRLRIVPADGLKPVKIDPGQMEQVIVNIAMNAADAMPNGGNFIIETKNVTLDEEYVRAFPELKPGGYTMLAMTDTGVGMSEEVRARAFEPFFSTKGVGEGTGLGLATCFGILKQSGGHLSVYSEVARGTTFKIYLPQVEWPATTPVLQAIIPDLPHGTETILLAEDDPFLLSMSASFLRRLGYTVITAANGVEALSLKHQPKAGHVDVLLTDVVMPHMSGKELADRIQAIYPHTKILFTSAYTENAIVHQGVLNEGVKFLQKPFTPAALANKLREVLDR